ncbi:hypothetical protein I6A84_42395 [Frankia sp. CNm7]|uniref:Uncharacterized protein n=1 Tax=Frankia nepalensis TaxID=1836974 RepID=A0A937RMA9_9ACTN|nr:CATRA conflict system CASPASE/TPR repeat-associated protein [Frankia nepalensis]MBL7496016.1 hypothetical protein [Frankia nepalensis]MBL7514871.1 hypothetical protein [Frankia nepalensis]MBL7524515.1 hypothetical protein [Frankia nepalensis]MBL7631429.1 hypothetical protein [Frankia nepalensis]
MSGFELVAYLFAPVDGPRAEGAYDHLRAVWTACRERLDMTRAVRGTDTPATLPALSGLGHRRVLAAQESPAEGIFQAVLRREHDLLCLSVMLAPPAMAPVWDWAALDAAWLATAGEPPPSLVGAARVYQGRLDETDESSGSSPDRAPAFAAALPEDLRAGAWGHHGVTTGSGLAVWEVGDRRDDRLERRFVVIAGAASDWDLSTWTWTRDDDVLPTLPSYLGHAAKVRYQWRIWEGGEPVRALHARAEARLRRLTGGPNDDVGRSGAADRGDRPRGAGANAAVVDDLRRDLLDLSTMSSRLVAMRQSVIIATANMSKILDADRTITRRDDPFGDDLAFAEHMTAQLEADAVFVAAAADRARAAIAHADESRGRSASAATEGGDVRLTPGDRQQLCDELAEIFGSGPTASQLLEQVGFPRTRHVSPVGLSPRSWWDETLRDLERGAIADPYRWILGAALRGYPYNRVFGALAGKHRLNDRPAPN